MTSDEWRRVRELFERALDREPAEVPHWLEQEAAGEPAVRLEVASLLAHHSGAGSFLAEPLTERVPDLFVDTNLLQPGTTIGAYTIIREIGRGGMGCVYLASDARLGRAVALKALSPRLAGDGAQRERLRREARAAAALTHPGICTVYALEEIDGALFMATEYIDGRTLREEIASGRPRSVDEIVNTARDLAAALASAHAKGITHRDLKPENVMRGIDGRLKILDFGLAQVDAAFVRFDGGDQLAGRLTHAGTLVGTPAYMAPEQLHGEPADPRSDVFSVGVLLYEYACGVHPFQARVPLAMAARVLESEAPPLDSLRPDVPLQFATVIERCLRKRPVERWPSGVDLALALARPAGSQQAADRIAFWWRTHQIVMIALYCVASVMAWQIKEWAHGLADLAFVAIGIAGTINGVLRGHLIFTNWVNRTAIETERTRTEPMTFVLDLAIAAVLAVAGVLVTPTRHLAATLTIALAAAIALARTIVEPATTAAAFGGQMRRE